MTRKCYDTSFETCCTFRSARMSATFRVANSAQMSAIQNDKKDAKIRHVHNISLHYSYKCLNKLWNPPSLLPVLFAWEFGSLHVQLATF